MIDQKLEDFKHCNFVVVDYLKGGKIKRNDIVSVYLIKGKPKLNLCLQNESDLINIRTYFKNDKPLNIYDKRKSNRNNQ